MKKMSRSILTILCGAMLAASFSGCQNNTAYALNIDGTDIRAGIYILNQQSAINAAYEKFTEENEKVDTEAESFDLFKQTIEGIPAQEWIDKKTAEYCAEIVAVDRLCAELNIELTDEEEDEIDDTVYSAWNEESYYAAYVYGTDTIGEYFESIGVGEKSYKDLQVYYAKSDKLFEYFYGAEGIEAVPEADINKEVTDNYAAVMYFIKNATTKESTEDFLKMLDTKKFEEVYGEHAKAIEIAKIEAAMKEAEEKDKEYTGTKLEDVKLTVPERDTLIKVLKSDATSPSEDFVKDVFKMDANTNKIIKVTSKSTNTDGEQVETTTEYIVQKLDITAEKELYEQYSETARHSLKDEDLKAKITEKAKTLTIVENEAAMNLYQAQNLVKK